MSVFEERRSRVCDWMAEEGVDVAMLEDFEGRRDSSIRYLARQPGDALLFLCADGRSLLVPWDINMARCYADVGAIAPYTDFERRPLAALRAACDYFQLPRGGRIEIPSSTSYPQFLRTVEALTDYDLLCREDGIASELERKRAIKDELEIAIYRKLGEITDILTASLEEAVRSRVIKTEIDAALFIEETSRGMGCEGTGFETLAAGPDRSFGIHCFPTYTASPFAGPGLSILDFGVKLEGYTSDVTLTFVRDTPQEAKLSGKREKLISLVEKAYKTALSMVREGERARALALAVDKVFSRSKLSMPHALGHGIGLDAHEGPMLRTRSDNTWVLTPGMIFTIEPGLYDPELGGCRLENDVLLTEQGAELLTHSSIIRI